MASYDRIQIKIALGLKNPALSAYLDIDTGRVVIINESDASPATEQLRTEVMDAYGARYRYIPGGNSAVDDAAIDSWLETEGLA